MLSLVLSNLASFVIGDLVFFSTVAGYGVFLVTWLLLIEASGTDGLDLFGVPLDTVFFSSFFWAFIMSFLFSLKSAMSFLI